MAAILRGQSSIWRRQPVNPSVGFDPEHPLVRRAQVIFDGRPKNARRLILPRLSNLYSGGESMIGPRVVGDIRGGGAIGWEVAPASLTYGDRFSTQFDWGPIPGLGSRFTILTVAQFAARPGSSNDFRSSFGVYGSDLATEGDWTIGVTSDPGWFWASFNGSGTDVGGYDFYYESGFPRDRMVARATTYDGTTLRERNSLGSSNSLTRSIGNLPANSGRKFQFGGRGNNDGHPTTIGYILVLPDFCPADGLVHDWLENPWAVYRPASRGNFISLGAGGGSYTLTLNTIASNTTEYGLGLSRRATLAAINASTLPKTLAPARSLALTAKTSSTTQYPVAIQRILTLAKIASTATARTINTGSGAYVLDLVKIATTATARTLNLAASLALTKANSTTSAATLAFQRGLVLATRASTATARTLSAARSLLLSTLTTVASGRPLQGIGDVVVETIEKWWGLVRKVSQVLARTLSRSTEG